jgi:trans-aconitate methyltransferase
MRYSRGAEKLTQAGTSGVGRTDDRNEVHLLSVNDTTRLSCSCHLACTKACLQEFQQTQSSSNIAARINRSVLGASHAVHLPSILENMANKDHWSAEKYKAAATYVPQLATRVTQYLDPQPGDHILDIGCGDGQLTSIIAQRVGSTGQILGLDASPSFIESAQSDNTFPHCSYAVQDCTALASKATASSASWDKAFSNAAMHWILKNEATRSSFFADVFALLKPGGKFVFEMGGKGNVAELHAAFIAALTTHGELSLAAARSVSPWFFPSTEWMARALVAAGFEVEHCETEYRPTKVTDEKVDGSGGREGWVRLMGASFLEAVDGNEKREQVVKAVCEWVEHVVLREEDGARWLGYVRLRAVGRKA